MCERTSADHVVGYGRITNGTRRGVPSTGGDRAEVLSDYIVVILRKDIQYPVGIGVTVALIDHTGALSRSPAGSRICLIREPGRRVTAKKITCRDTVAHAPEDGFGTANDASHSNSMRTRSGKAGVEKAGGY